MCSVPVKGNCFYSPTDELLRQNQRMCFHSQKRQKTYMLELSWLQRGGCGGGHVVLMLAEVKAGLVTLLPLGTGVGLTG